MNERKGPWTETFTGKQFFPMDFRVEDICLEDIAHALSLLCRFSGHVRKFYSVAEHSIRVANVLKPLGPEIQRIGLLHDASEAYIVDLPRPVKEVLPGYRDLERSLEGVLATRFNIRFPFPREVKDADNLLLITEARDLLPSHGITWEGPYPEPLENRIHPLEPYKAEQKFLWLAKDLGVE